MTDFDYISSAQRTLSIEADAVTALKDRLGNDFITACELLINCTGRVVVTGMGKSGHIGKKMAATLASTGTPSFFVHPGEASHGDLGMITPNDVVIAISNSGNTSEVVTILPLIKRMQTPMISITGNPASAMAKAAVVNLDISVKEEACPLGLAPTASTTATLAMGDALAVALLEAKGFTPEDFAFSHPGGALGRRLLLKVDDLMHKGDDIPTVTPDTLIKDALLEVTRKKLGMTAIIDPKKGLVGVFTDGDLRRVLDNETDFHSTSIEEVMTSPGVRCQSGILAAEALNIMETKSINGLFVTDENDQVVGALNMHDLLKAGIM
ncbi:KpsF/GutQ family sugar-phosphate isomerase [Litoribrevibacter albus]|uniref:Arabinose 5-phosphate isomerase n=1 Tax=Litoribrevibacter albus TaxID=1473156 RepID=A0AA37SAD4_9GAMM|nr:KpsF/GutQ family sugar-phosphate isomerase [Litoribrevibacter albus]GLQ31295.1 arabinose 5-phosphate isomerase KdsD [Litoribrevibacter albus]